MQETLYLLAKVFGLFFIICAPLIMFRQQYFSPVIGGFVKDKPLRMMWGFVELIFGLFLVVLQPLDMSSVAAGIVSVTGWIFLIEGLMYVTVSDRWIERFVKMVNVPAWYIGGGIVSLVIGLYLAAFGFGLI